MLKPTRPWLSRLVCRIGPSISRLVATGFLMWIASPATPVSGATFTPIVESFVTPVPGSPAVTFGVFPTPPSFDGQRVVFASQQPFTTFRSLWSADPNGGSLVSLADDNTPIPGGGGRNFGNVFPFGIANGRVVFFGNDDATQRGYYSVPATGGPVTLLLNNGTLIPGGNNYFDVNFQSHFNTDGGTVVFEDRGSIYAVPSTGGAASLVAGGVFICEANYLGGGVGQFLVPDLSGGTVVIFASFGQGLIFTSPLSGLTSTVQMCPGAGSVPVATNATRVATLNTVVPGDPQDRTFDSTAFHLPIIDGGTVIFGGAALNSNTLGIFSWRAGTLTRLVDTNMPVPGGTGTFQPLSVGQLTYTTSNGHVVFRGVDAAGKTGLYYVSASGGTVVKIIAEGDPLDGGRTVGSLPQEAIGANSLSGSKLAFIVNVNDPKVGLAKSVYVADLSTAVLASVLPSSRSVQVPGIATVFASMIAVGTVTATNCSISPITGIPATFVYQTTNPATNALTGSPNTPVNIPAGGLQTFLLAFTSRAPFGPMDVELGFHCDNAAPAPVISGLSTVLLSASTTPVPDIVALAASGDPGIVDIPGATGTGVFAVATVNVGSAGGSIIVSADTGNAALPVVLSICQTNPGTGACFSGPSPTVTATINPGETPTFGIFVAGAGAVTFDPAKNRIVVRFKDQDGVTRGATSVAVRTQ